MARINVDEKWLSKDPRRKRWVKAVGDEYTADGLALHFWLIGQEAYGKGKNVNKKLFNMMPHAADFLACELAEERPDGIYIKGSKRRQEWYRKCIEAGAAGGKKSAEKRKKRKGNQPDEPQVKGGLRVSKGGATPGEPQANPLQPNGEPSSSSSPSCSPSSSASNSHRPAEQVDLFQSGADAPAPGPAKKPRRRSNDTEDEATRELRRQCWELYKQAYQKRWKKEPVRNATVNAQVASLVRRLGKDAPQVLEFYVGHADTLYVRNCHPVGLCLKNAEGLHTQWSNKIQITNSKMKQYEQGQHYREQASRVESGEL